MLAVLLAALESDADRQKFILGKFMNDKVWIRSLALGVPLCIVLCCDKLHSVYSKKILQCYESPMGGLWNAPVHANYYRLSR